MGNVKLVVIYPQPKDTDAFEKVYENEHVPLAVAKLGGKSKIVATKILGSPQGTPPFYRVAEVYFLSVDARTRGVRRVGRRQRSPSTRRQDLFWGDTDFFGGRGRDFHFHPNSKCLAEKQDAFQAPNC